MTNDWLAACVFSSLLINILAPKLVGEADKGQSLHIKRVVDFQILALIDVAFRLLEDEINCYVP